MDKKNLFKKGNNRCVIWNYFQKRKISLEKFFENLSCVDSKTGFCKKKLIKVNCSISKQKVLEMIKNNYSTLEIRKYINDNVF